MSTLKAFLKDKNKNELLDDLKSIQKSLDSSDLKENKNSSKEKDKSKTKYKLFSFTKKK